MSAEQSADVMHTNVSAGLADQGHDLKAEAHIESIGSGASHDQVRPRWERPITITTDPTLFQRLPRKRRPDGIHVRPGDPVEIVLGSLRIVGHVESL